MEKGGCFLVKKICGNGKAVPVGRGTFHLIPAMCLTLCSLRIFTQRIYVYLLVGLYVNYKL